MIKEIVPFFETFVTPRMGTEQLLHYSFRSRVFQLKDQVIGCLWDFTVFDLLGQLSSWVE
jgi:hypothetical protein